MAHLRMSTVVGLSLAMTFCSAAPHHYVHMHSTEAVRVAHAEMRAWIGSGGQGAPGAAWAARRRLAAKDDGPDCGTALGKDAPRDPMWFTQSGCSISSQDGYAYIDSASTFRNASKGDLIQVRDTVLRRCAAAREGARDHSKHALAARGLARGRPRPAARLLGPLALRPRPSTPATQGRTVRFRYSAPRATYNTLPLPPPLPCPAPQRVCEDVFCPTPAVPDCYENPGICADGEWCWIDQHEKASVGGARGGRPAWHPPPCALARPWAQPCARARRPCLPAPRHPAARPPSPPRSGALGAWPPAASRPPPSAAVRRLRPRSTSRTPARKRRRPCARPSRASALATSPTLAVSAPQHTHKHTHNTQHKLKDTNSPCQYRQARSHPVPRLPACPIPPASPHARPHACTAGVWPT